MGEEEEKPDQLTQLVTTFSRKATTETAGGMKEDHLYMNYAEIMAKSCGEEEEEGGGDEEGGEEDSGPVDAAAAIKVSSGSGSEQLPLHGVSSCHASLLSRSAALRPTIYLP